MIFYDPKESVNEKDIKVANGLIYTPKGVIHLEGPVTKNYVQRLSMHQELNNFRPADRQQAALATITELPNGRVFLARYDQEIIGYVTFHHPDEYSRWHKHPWVLELGAIEVSRSWRKYKVAQHLLQQAFSNDFIEDFIIITIEYCWHWDLRSSGLTMWDYQRMLTKLFSSVGLKKRATDDPDILEHPANVLMVRPGKNVPKEAIQRFEELTFRSKFF